MRGMAVSVDERRASKRTGASMGRAVALTSTDMDAVLQHAEKGMMGKRQLHSKVLVTPPSCAAFSLSGKLKQ